MDNQISSTTLVILLGASEWPSCPEFIRSPAFVQSAQRLKAYLLSPFQFGLPQKNMLDLFDTDQSADEIDQAICDFLNQHTKDVQARNVIIYYIGHGGFTGSDNAYHLLIKRTRSASMRVSSIEVAALAETLKERARRLRRYVYTGPKISDSGIR